MANVTVVIPALNGADMIRNCLRAPGLLLDGCRPRVIVADNGSTDDTAEIASGLGADVVTVGRQGPAAARNGGLEAADTEFVAFIDADCVAMPGWLDALAHKAAANGHVGVGGMLHWCAASAAEAAFYQDYYPCNEVLCASGPTSYILTSNAIFRRRELLDAGGFDARLPWCEDLELGIRLTHQGYTFGFTPEAIVEVHAPAGMLDRLGQFYKYGYGLQHIRTIHPDIIEWSAWCEWKHVLEAGRRTQTERSGDPCPRNLIFQMRLAYFAGWLDARVRQSLNFCSLTELPVHFRGHNGGDKSPFVCLSIDDGPSAVTSDILNLLDRHRAKATFFVIGERAAARPALVRDMVARGHEIFAHGWTHRRFDCLTEAAIGSELQRTEEVLRQARPTPRRYLVRLPYGAGADDVHVHGALRRWNRDCEIVQWSAELGEWNIAIDSDVRSCCADLVDQLMVNTDLSGAILLLHDSPIGLDPPHADQISLYSLDQTLNALSNQGFAITSLGEHHDARRI